MPRKSIWQISEANDSGHRIGRYRSEDRAICRATAYSRKHVTAVLVQRGTVIEGEFHEDDAFVIDETEETLPAE